jgi:hypothetical protein
MPRWARLQPAQLLLSLNGPAQTPPWSTSNLSFTPVWPPPSSLRLLQCWQAMAQPLLLGRNARIRHRSQPPRQRKMNGMVTWHFDLVMECLPLCFKLRFSSATIQPPLLHQQGRRGCPHRVHLVRSPLLPPHHLRRHPFLQLPFQTPPSLILRFLIRFDNPQEISREDWKVVEAHLLPEKEAAETKVCQWSLQLGQVRNVRWRQRR